MRPRTYDILSEAIEAGIASGWRHAHDHANAPGQAAICEHIEHDIMNEVCERFSFDDDLEPTAQASPVLRLAPDAEWIVTIRPARPTDDSDCGA